MSLLSGGGDINIDKNHKLDNQYNESLILSDFDLYEFIPACESSS